MTAAHRRREQNGPVAVASSTHWRVLLTVGLYFVANSLVQTFIPLTALNRGLNGLQAGIILVFVGGGTGVFTDLGFAAFGDRWGLDRVVRLGLVTALASIAVVATTTTATGVVAGAVAYGIGASAIGCSMLALLSRTAMAERQLHTQGFNGAVQRFGALVAAGLVGYAVGRSRLGLLEVSGIVALGLAVIATWGTGAGLVSEATGTGNDRAEPREGVMEAVKRGYRQGARSVGSPAMLASALVNIALGLIFVATNSFVPLISRAPHASEGFVVGACLGCRDVVAIATALAIAYGPAWLMSRTAITGSLVIAVIGAGGLAATISSRDAGALVAFCGAEGIAVGVGIAATNLFAIGASVPNQRALGMASAGLLNRVAGIGIPLMLGWCVTVGGLGLTFLSVSLTLAVLAGGVGLLMSRTTLVPRMA